MSETRTVPKSLPSMSWKGDTLASSTSEIFCIFSSSTVFRSAGALLITTMKSSIIAPMGTAWVAMRFSSLAAMTSPVVFCWASPRRWSGTWRESWRTCLLSTPAAVKRRSRISALRVLSSQLGSSWKVGVCVW